MLSGNDFQRNNEVDVDRQRQAATAATFLARHRAPPVLLLPNAWDAMSARIFIAAGFDALATTSGGVAWALGYPDGEAAPWAEVVTATALSIRPARSRADRRIRPGGRRAGQHHRPRRHARCEGVRAYGRCPDHGCFGANFGDDVGDAKACSAVARHRQLRHAGCANAPSRRPKAFRNEGISTCKHDWIPAKPSPKG